MVGDARMTEISSTLKIIPAFPVSRFKRGPSELPFAYFLYGVLFLICSKIVTDLLEDFHAKKVIF